MKFIVSRIAKEILAEQEQVRIFKEAYEIELQNRINQACNNDKSHTQELSS